MQSMDEMDEEDRIHRLAYEIAQQRLRDRPGPLGGDRAPLPCRFDVDQAMEEATERIRAGEETEQTAFNPAEWQASAAELQQSVAAVVTALDQMMKHVAAIGSRLDQITAEAVQRTEQTGLSSNNKLSTGKE